LKNFKYNNTKRTTLKLKVNCIKYISKNKFVVKVVLGSKYGDRDVVRMLYM